MASSHCQRNPGSHYRENIDEQFLHAVRTALGWKEGKAKTKSRSCEPSWFYPPFAPALSPPWGQEEGEPQESLKAQSAFTRETRTVEEGIFSNTSLPKQAEAGSSEGMAKDWEQGSWVFPVCFIWNKRAGKHFLWWWEQGQCGKCVCVASPEPWPARAEDNSPPSVLQKVLEAAQTRSQRDGVSTEGFPAGAAAPLFQILPPEWLQGASILIHLMDMALPGDFKSYLLVDLIHLLPYSIKFVQRIWPVLDSLHMHTFLSSVFWYLSSWGRFKIRWTISIHFLNCQFLCQCLVFPCTQTCRKYIEFLASRTVCVCLYHTWMFLSI